MLTFGQQQVTILSQALVIGFGISGKASAKLLLAKGYSVTALDRRFETLEKEPRILLMSDEADLPWPEFSIAVVSPGIDPSHPLLKKLQVAGVEVLGEIELALRHLPNRTLLGVTGTNGKTTTVLLTTHILNAAGKKAAPLGNVGVALSTYALNPNENEILVIELSSFQLEKLSIKGYFDAAVILNITPNHLNRHASMEEYANAKLVLAKCLKEGGKLFLSKQVERDFGIQGGVVFDSSNESAARALATFCKVSKLAADNAIKTFKKPPHRIEWVAEIDGVAYYNDSKASNIEAVIYAMRFFSGPILLLAGGVDKGSSYTPWIEPFQGKVKGIAVFGAAAEKMERELSPFLRLERFSTMKEALGFAKRNASAGDTILLSPGCSSYDQFANYEERGEVFKKMVRGDEWIEKKP